MGQSHVKCWSQLTCRHACFDSTDCLAAFGSGDAGNYGAESCAEVQRQGTPGCWPRESHGEVCCAALDSCIALFWETRRIAASASCSSAGTNSLVPPLRTEGSAASGTGVGCFLL